MLTELKKADNSAYQDICYEIGESFLFYFDVSVERDRYSNAAKWFKDASSKYPIADIYCKMSDCLELINQYNGAKIKQTDNIYGEYEKLWSMVGELKSKADEFDSIDSKLQVWREINDMIDNNVSPFLEVTSANDLKNMLNGISSEAGKVTKSVVESDIKDLQSKIADTVKKIESASNQGV